MQNREVVLHELAAVQCGLFSRSQALVSGCDDALIGRRVRAGRWVRYGRGVYGFPGLPPDPDRELWVACLEVGGPVVVSHERAADHHGLDAVPRGLITLTAPRSSHPRLGGPGTVHQLDDLREHHVVAIRGLQTTTVARTLVDCAAVVSQVRTDHLVDQALGERLTKLSAIHRVVDDVRRSGKRGIGAMATSLHRHGPGTPVASNELERLLLRAVLGAGNPPPVPQFPHPGRHPGQGRVDFAYPAAKLILEADGRTWHQRIADIGRDRARDNEAARAGWLTLRFLWEDLRNDPDDAGATVRDVLVGRTRAA